jgi:hypothetical protein
MTIIRSSGMVSQRVTEIDRHGSDDAVPQIYYRPLLALSSLDFVNSTFRLVVIVIHMLKNIT